jgi:hypothetical protein
VADAEVDPPVTRRAPAFLAAVVVVLGLLVVPLLAPGSAAEPLRPGQSGTPPLVGNVSGPSIVATSTNTTFYLNASGGPAVVNGSFVGIISWSASLSGPSTTSTFVTPLSGNITTTTVQPVAIIVTTSAAAQTLTLSVAVKSTFTKVNTSLTLTHAFRVAVPYIVYATLVAGRNASVLPFNVTVALDGTFVGFVHVPELAPGESYPLLYRYPTTGLGSGYHTFTLSVSDEHGLVTFAGGRTVQSATFYVAPAPMSNTIWYITGVVAFFGALFIYATRVAARRRGAARR